MNHQRSSAKAHTGAPGGVIVVGAGPVGCTAALLLADQGVPVTLLERHPQPHPLPRAVHLDDEVARTLYRAGVSAGFLAQSRSCSGLRLLDADHRVMAEFSRAHEIGIHGFPQANMFHQPDLEDLLLTRAGQHPLIGFHRDVEVTAMDSAFAPLTGDHPVEVHAEAAADGSAQTFTGRLVLGCDGANSTIRDLAGITMEDLGFTERWLVIDIRSDKPLDTWDGVEQICDPARAATFMQVTGHRYRWEFQLHDGDDEADMITPDSLGKLLEPWTGRRHLDGLQIIRSATYTFRARLAARFQAGRVFLLGDAAHLTPPFIGQGLAAGLRDADNLAWKIAHVLTGQAGEDLLATYDAERRPHAKAMINKAIRVGWAMTGGQDRAAAVRRFALAAAVRSDRVCEAIASTATPRLKTGALQHRPRPLRSRTPATMRPGSLIGNPLVSIVAGGVPTGDGVSAAEATPARLDAVLRGRTTVLTARQPDPGLIDLCRRHGLLLVKISAPATAAGCAPAAAPDPQTASGWVEVRLDDSGGAGCFQALTARRDLTIIVRPDRVIAAVATRSQLPRLPWSTTAAPVALASQMTPVSQT